MKGVISDKVFGVFSRFKVIGAMSLGTYSAPVLESSLPPAMNECARQDEWSK